MNRADEGRRFLEALWPDATDAAGILTLWTAPAKRTYRHAMEPATIATKAANLAGTANVFFGVGLRRSDLNGSGRGSKADVTTLPALWADVDLDDEPAARAAVTRFPLPPSALIWSGHGLHAYWFLAEPWTLTDAATRKAADAFLKRFGRTLAGDYIDPAVFELARVMRLPGTVNRKGDPVPVRLLELEPERRYTRDELAAHFVPETAHQNGHAPKVKVTKGADWDDAGRLAAYVQRAVDLELAALANAREGGRNAALNSAAYALGQLIGGGYLAESEAVEVLRRGATACGLWADDGPESCERTMRSGLEAGKAQPRLIELEPNDFTNNRTGAAPKATKATDAVEHCPPGLYPLEDVGNGERLVSLYGDKLLWCGPWDKWIVWDGQRWKVDDLAHAVALAKATAVSMYDEARHAFADATAAAKTTSKDDAAKLKDLADATWKHAKASNAAARLRSMLYVTQPDVATLPDSLDPDPWLLTVDNGTIDLRTGDLRPHNRDDLITKLSPVRYDPVAKCPAWLAFLGEVMAGDSDRIGFLQRAVGYSLTGDTREQVLLILHGTGSNGKTTFIETCQDLMGDYGRRTPAQTLLDANKGGGDAIPNDLAALKGARMVFASETEDNRRLAEAKVKAITGGDRISARFMRAEWFEYRPQFKLWLATNHKPNIHGTDHAIWRRIRLVPWEVTIPDADQDKTLPDRLRAELPGILAWAVEGCIAWQRDGLGNPEAVQRATAAYREGQDVLGGFLTECCVVAPHAEAGATALYQTYRTWCEANGEYVVKQRKFGEALAERGFESFKNNISCWRGVGLLARDG